MHFAGGIARRWRFWTSRRGRCCDPIRECDHQEARTICFAASRPTRLEESDFDGGSTQEYATIFVPAGWRQALGPIVSLAVKLGNRNNIRLRTLEDK